MYYLSCLSDFISHYFIFLVLLGHHWNRADRRYCQLLAVSADNFHWNNNVHTEGRIH